MIRKLRLCTGVLLALFISTHLLNHAMGLVSIGAAEQGLKLFVGFWHSPLPTLLLYGSLLTHLLLGFWSLYQRNTLKMPWWEAAQLLLGLLIPPLLVAHVIGTRLSAELMGLTPSYEKAVPVLWAIDNGIARQTALALVVWLHLLIGLHFWQRLRTGYQQWLPLWQLLASLLPLLALLGFYRLGFELGPADLAQRSVTMQQQFPDQTALLKGLDDRLLQGYLLALLLVMMARQFRHWIRGRKRQVLVDHPSRGQIRAEPGQTLLEALRQADIPHSSVCGGRARCTTCRVRVTRGADQLPAPDSAEQQALAGIKSEPNVRLACQLRLQHDLAVVPLIPPEMGMNYIRKPGGVEGQEQRVSVLFIDLRGSTALAEQRLPYDVVFILNQFFAEMAEVLEQTDGHYAQFNGDGLMALYGLGGEFEQGCRQAIVGAREMLKRLDGLNQRLQAELQQPLKVGIGVHSGEAIVGTMGPPNAPILSAIGDTINTAARIEAETKKYGISLILSQETVDGSGLILAETDKRHLTLRGRQQLQSIYLVSDPFASIRF